MIIAVQKIWCRRIYDGVYTIDNVPTESQELVRAMYKKMNGIDL